MRDILKTEELSIPEGVTVAIKSRIINVEGPRGKLEKNVRHINMDIQLIKGKENKVTLAVWQGGRKHVACLRTIKSLIENMVTGVTKVRNGDRVGKAPKLTLLLNLQGFRYKMRLVYAHFPINCIIQEGGTLVEIRNFLGEKVRRSNDFATHIVSDTSVIKRPSDMFLCWRA
jgi:large subunit ribosomal protein L9e